jgi:hypothetical protein
MAEPVSWLLIEPGWRVVDADGEEVGRVAEVVGDSTVDIFDGLAVALGMLAKPRYVAAEQVAELTDGTVRLALDHGAVEALPEYAEPGETVEVSAEKASFAQRVGSDLVPPGRTERIPVLRRVLLWFGLAGRR